MFSCPDGRLPVPRQTWNSRLSCADGASVFLAGYRVTSVRHDQLINLWDANTNTVGGFWSSDGGQLFTNGENHLSAEQVVLAGDGDLLPAQLVLEQLTLFATHLSRLLRPPIAWRKCGDADGGNGKV